jgi:hypothetical protein
MFCPHCGAKQAEGKKFCTLCGTNLSIVSQALSGQMPAPGAYVPAPNDPREVARQREMAKGVKLTVVGGAFVAVQFFKLIFSIPWGSGGSPFSGWGFIGLIIAAVGIAKIINSRPVYGAMTHTMPMPAPPQVAQPDYAPPRPIFSAPPPVAQSVSPTGNLEPVSRTPSAVEEETQHLPEYAPPREVPK